MRWRRFFHRTRDDADHASEFQSFLEAEIDDNLARGMSPEAARRTAHLKFGNPTALREQVYDMHGIGFLEALFRDTCHALRVLKGAPTFTAVSLLTLALGIGATTAIFTLVSGVILRPLPYPDPSRLLTVWETNPSHNLAGLPPGCIAFSPGNYLDLRDQNRSFSQLGGFATTSYNLTGGAIPDRVAGGLVSAGVFPALGLRPVKGRLYTAFAIDGAEGVLHARNLDWWTENFALGRLTTVCHFVGGGAGRFTTVGWPGFVV